MPKLCVDCKFYQHSEDTMGFRSMGHITHECHCPFETKPNVVTGEIDIYNCCFKERMSSGRCGPDAKYYEEFIENTPWWRFW